MLFTQIWDDTKGSIFKFFGYFFLFCWHAGLFINKTVKDSHFPYAHCSLFANGAGLPSRINWHSQGLLEFGGPKQGGGLVSPVVSGGTKKTSSPPKWCMVEYPNKKSLQFSCRTSNLLLSSQREKAPQMEHNHRNNAMSRSCKLWWWCDV